VVQGCRHAGNADLGAPIAAAGATRR